MLTYNPKDRISAIDALNDKWIQANSSQNQLNVKFLSNLSGFHVWKNWFFALYLLNLFKKKAKNKLKQAILAFIATQVVSQADKDDLQKAFKALDKDSDGKLTREELIEGFTSFIIWIKFTYFLKRVFEIVQ